MKESRLSIRVDDAIKARLAKVVEDTGIGEASVVKALVIALCDYAETKGEITLPLAIIPKKQLAQLATLETC